MTTEMQAWVVRSAGGAPALEQLRVPVPRPTPSEVLIRVEACGLNFVDLLMMAGHYQVPTDFPHVPGLEVCGTVLEEGEDVVGLRAGDRVAARCERGGLAEFVTTTAERCVPIPGEVPAAAAATFLVSFGTADHFLRHHGTIGRGSRVLVLGAAGAVGSAALQIARAAEAEPLGVVSSSDKRDLAITNGATRCLVLSRNENAAAALKRFVGKHRPDIVLDPVGGELTEGALRVIAPSGKYLVVGFAAGIPRVPLNLPLIKRCAIIGDSYRAYCDEAPQASRKAARELVRELARGILRPHVQHVFEFADAPRAFSTLADRATVGRVTLLVGGGGGG